MKKTVFVVFLTLFVSISGWLGAGAPGEAAEGGKAVVNEQVRDLQERILNDQELMSLVMALSADPEMQELMNDPAVLSAVNSLELQPPSIAERVAWLRRKVSGGTAPLIDPSRS